MGILLFRVKEIEDIEKAIDSRNIIYCKYSTSFEYLNTVISKLLSLINETTKSNFVLNVDIERDRTEIYNLYVTMEKENSLLAKRPQIASEWHPSLNGKLLPIHVSEYSNKPVYWLCSKCGHEWKTAVNNRSNGTGCPVCSRKVGAIKRRQKQSKTR
jgi:hypothetical protein